MDEWETRDVEKAVGRQRPWVPPTGFEHWLERDPRACSVEREMLAERTLARHPELNNRIRQVREYLDYHVHKTKLKTSFS